MANFLEDLDAKLGDILAGWNSLTILLGLGCLAFFVYTLYDMEDADTHPMLLLRQSSAGQVRQPGESTIYRANDTPAGYPLKTGLNVKPPSAPLYSPGQDGDLRDVWRRVRGELPARDLEGKGKLLTVLGKEEVEEHDVEEVTKEIVAVGESLVQHGCKRVAVYLPNSVEFLSTVFAATFYGATPILLPFNQPHETIVSLLRETNADALVAQAGSLPLSDVIKSGSSLQQVIWVVEKTSRHVDWTEVPGDVGGKTEVCVWHDLVADHRNGSELPKDIPGGKLGGLVTIWQDQPGAEGEIVEFSQQNMVSGIGAAVTALPPRQRMTPADQFLAADSFSDMYTLTLTLAALFSLSTVVINSVAGPGVDLSLAARQVSPTIIVASAESMAKLHATTSAGVTGSLKQFAHYTQTKALGAGRMPADTLLTRLNAPTKASIGATPGKLRLVFTSEKIGGNTPPLTSIDLNDLRVFTGARIIYALTAAKVAGAVSQTSIFDYRREDGNKHSHFGPPMGSVEIKLVDTKDHKISDEGNPVGEIVVWGPAVAGATAKLGIVGTFRDDQTLAYI
ncbi:hypothetical protein K402DRAFT_369142 [Aulographum hederae CBS 113979]|uniref:AMP-dependent synthetase/ligase domain-containing protein n=1 Tax=Aulographum hederae CBS 113979 TaxID=1176131 RepID=A0A6G1HDW1_9PEZI|nr:hypothetical protein K402DRAFT_369142 [Aulographum hederae CBS 113979]